MALREIQSYKKLYDLIEIIHNEPISRGAFHLYKKRHFFIIVAIYNSKKEVFLVRDFNKNVGWELPGGYVYDKENIIDAVNRIVSKETGLEINELEPIATAYNNFSCGGRRIQHKGLAFIAHSRGKIKNYPQNIKGCFVKNNRYKLAYQNDEILRISKEKIRKKTHNPPEEEIDSVNKNRFTFLYFLHKYLIKPIGRFSSIQIEGELLSLIDGSPKTILDPSCGESNILNLLYNKYYPQTCVGNDICWKTISLIRNKNPKIIFTNHNLLELPYKTKFDLIIFKNTLHHINKDYHHKIINNLKSMAKQLVIIDVDDLIKYSFWSKLWNKYYVYFLGDRGESFLNFPEFKKLIEKSSTGRAYKIKKIKTIKGGYFIASVE
ncbi:MAG: NUDIX domain-containing protein [Candidatus Pacebacteria bacterium]|nr:NUDIX domain-containing protein [Candidatus Paceibacterota bacterium]